MDLMEIDGWFADFEKQNFFFGQMTVVGGKIAGIRETGLRRLTWEEREQVTPVILPGLVDSHVHIESSMVLPSRFAKQAVRFGTVSTVSDPHEIANVLGLEGIDLMIRDARSACFDIHFTAPSCVPATQLETAGATLKAENLEKLFSENRVVALGEMMNYPGVLGADAEVTAKIGLAKRYGKPVDGHAPGLTGSLLDTYIQAGIDTDHECSTLEEAEEKILKGMKVLIREGSSARNFDQLYPLIDRYPDRVMLCTDDYHPDDLMSGHIDRIIRKGVLAGTGFFNIYRAGSINPIRHYHLDTGMLEKGDSADFIIADGVDPFVVRSTFIKGKPVFRDGMVAAGLPVIEPLNAFYAREIVPADIEISGQSGLYRVIRVYDGELLTGSETANLLEIDGIVQGDIGRDILKIVVINRYHPSKPSVGWITGFGIGRGAIASSIAHDSHNIIAVGCSDSEIAEAVNQVIRNQGGISVSEKNQSQTLPLPVAGLMSMLEVEEVGVKYAGMTETVRNLGSTLKAPFMALSFMALLVIPHLKIGDRGLFNCDNFEFTDLRAD